MFTRSVKLSACFSMLYVLRMNACTRSPDTDSDVSMAMAKSCTARASRYSKGSMSGMLPYRSSP